MARVHELNRSLWFLALQMVSKKHTLFHNNQLSVLRKQGLMNLSEIWRVHLAGESLQQVVCDLFQFVLPARHGERPGRHRNSMIKLDNIGNVLTAL